MTNVSELTTEQIEDLTSEERKQYALAEFLGVNAEDIELGYDDNVFEHGGAEYLVLMDSEAEVKTKEYIENSLWVFNAEFIIENSDLPWEAKEMIQTFQEQKCEGANETIAALITDIDSFVEAAISADGRGHFLSQYDGEENVMYATDDYAEDVYIYRTN